MNKNYFLNNIRAEKVKYWHIEDAIEHIFQKCNIGYSKYTRQINNLELSQVFGFDGIEVSKVFHECADYEHELVLKIRVDDEIFYFSLSGFDDSYIDEINWSEEYTRVYPKEKIIIEYVKEKQ